MPKRPTRRGSFALHLVDLTLGGSAAKDGTLEVRRSGYVIREVKEQTSITCFTCGRTSYNRTDVEQKYCGHCHTFHEGP